MLPESQNYINTFAEFKSQPKQYYQWKCNQDDNLLLYVIDSSFVMANYYVVNKVMEHTYYDEPYYADVYEELRFHNTFVIHNDGDLLIAAPYSKDSTWVDFHENGMAVALYDLRTMQRKALMHFDDISDPSISSHCLCFEKSSDGNLYLVYKEAPSMSIVKMDHDLNVIWKRFCFEPGSLKVDPYAAHSSNLLYDAEGKESGIYIAGYSSRLSDNKGGIFFFFVNDEGLTTVEEGAMEIRPYAFYPNPTHDRLCLQFSPDVQPKQIELHDLQGRLVLTQRKGLESIDISHLPAGIYMMRVTMEDGKTFTDKVVKE